MTSTQVPISDPLADIISPLPPDEFGTFNKTMSKSVSSSTIISIVSVCAAVMLAILFSMYYKLKHKPYRQNEATTSSLTPSSVNVEANPVVEEQPVRKDFNQPGTITNYPANWRMLPAITTIQPNGVTGTDEIVQLHIDLPSNQEPLPIPTNLTPHQIFDIKNYCHDSQLIGQGSFAKVFKGVFEGKDMAIKKIEHRCNDTKKSVESEVRLLQGKEHKNINRLYAWSIEENVSYLVYMHIGGCSLDDYLRGNCKGFAYSWKQCFRMIMGIAEGIEFLHINKILHVDIKPQNIMLDANDNDVKLVDFGFSRHVDWKGTHRSTDELIGTKGYWAPEYCLNHKLSYKHDVYSFGIVVLEMITGQRHVDTARSSSHFHIPKHVEHMIHSKRFEQVVDQRLKQDGWDRFGLEKALAVANIALRCADQEKDRRPYMDVVVKELTSMMMDSSRNNIIVDPIEEEHAIITHAR